MNFFHVWNVLFRAAGKGFRRFYRSPLFSTVAIAQMSLGVIGVTLSFTLLDSMILRPLPFAEGTRMVMLWSENRTKNLQHQRVTPDTIDDIRMSQLRSLEQLTEFRILDEVFGKGGEARQIRYAETDDHYFDFFSMRVLVGRRLLANDPQSTIVISERLWNELFAHSTEVLGRTVFLGNRPYTVAGVVHNSVFPTDFDAWIPIDRTWHSRSAHSIYLVGRLRLGMEPANCESELNRLSLALEQSYPATDTGWTFRVIPLRDEMLGNSRTVVLVACAAGLLVLLVGCFNSATLMIARFRARMGETAIRVSLGATYIHLISDVMAEAIALGCVATVLGLGLASTIMRMWVARAFASHWQTLPEIQMDWRVFLLAPAVLVFSSLCLCFWPAVQTIRMDMGGLLKSMGRYEGKSGLVSSLLLVLEVAITVCLVVSSCLMMHTWIELKNTYPGFTPRGVSTADFVLSGFGDNSPEQRRHYLTSLLESAHLQCRGVDAQLTSSMPFSGYSEPFNVVIEGVPMPEMKDMQKAEYRSISHGFLQTLRIPLLYGRHFGQQDRSDSALVVIINRSMASLYWGNEHAIGRRISVDGPQGPWRMVIGVVGDTREVSLEKNPFPEMYFPMDQEMPRRITLVLRTIDGRRVDEQRMRQIFQNVRPDVIPYHVTTAEDLLTDSFADVTARVGVLEGCAVVAMLLALFGIFCFCSYSVSQRTSEVAIRLALGATRAGIFRIFLLDGLRLVGAGAVVGMLAVVALTRLADANLHLDSRTNIIVWFVSGIGTCLVALTAMILPVMEATRIEPIRILKSV